MEELTIRQFLKERMEEKQFITKCIIRDYKKVKEYTIFRSQFFPTTDYEPTQIKKALDSHFIDCMYNPMEMYYIFTI